MCMKLSTGFKVDSVRATHLCEHFGRTDKIALITCLKHFNMSGSSRTEGNTYLLSRGCPPAGFLMPSLCHRTPKDPAILKILRSYEFCYVRSKTLR